MVNQHVSTVTAFGVADDGGDALGDAGHGEKNKEPPLRGGINRQAAEAAKRPGRPFAAKRTVETQLLWGSRGERSSSVF